MIIDELVNAENYVSLNKNFKTVFDYVKNNNLSDMECGSYELDGKNLYFNLQEYETKPVQKLEAHKKYIDIQIVVKGEEYMGRTDIGKTEVTEEYDETKDVMFLSGEVDKVKAGVGSFVVFYPWDAHMPSLAVDEPKYAKKAIFKILIKQ